jgi:hypothetical protein
MGLIGSPGQTHGHVKWADQDSRHHRFQFFSIANVNVNCSTPILAHKTTTNMQALWLRGWPRRHGAAASTLINIEKQMLMQPDETAQDARLEQIILDITNEYRPDSTSTTYDAKSKEYFGYCTSLYPGDCYAMVLSQYKVYRFMFYQSFCNQKKRGGTRNATRANGNSFVRSDYDSVMAKYDNYLSNHSDGLAPPKPTKPVCKQTINQYKAVLRWIYKSQTAQILALVWDQICTLPCAQGSQREEVSYEKAKLQR